jgi:hypothetical protein
MNETCPYCLRDVRFDIGARFQYENERHEIQQCQACGHPVYRLLDPTRARVVAQWPPKGIRPVHPAVPPPIAADWREAHLSLSIGAFRGAAAMARRAVPGLRRSLDVSGWWGRGR